ncbi:hypothetical protein D3C79_821260 [compost metagenome]
MAALLALVRPGAAGGSRLLHALQRACHRGDRQPLRRFFRAAGGGLAAVGWRRHFARPVRRPLSQPLAGQAHLPPQLPARLSAHLLGRPAAAGAVRGALAAAAGLLRLDAGPRCGSGGLGRAAAPPHLADHHPGPARDGQHSPAHPGAGGRGAGERLHPLRSRPGGRRLAHAALSRAAPRPDPGALSAVCLLG